MSIQQIVLMNPGTTTVTLNTLTLSESGASSTGITSLSLVANGAILETVNVAGGATTFNLTSSNSVPAGNGAVTYQVTANFSNNAPTGNYSFSITNGSATNGQAVNLVNLPVAGAVVTMTTVTSTPSNTPENTWTATATASGNQLLVVYPNPATGGTVSVLPASYTGVSDVQVQIFTIAFRMVQQETYPSVPPGMAVKVSLTDKGGVPLANGLYYLVVTVNGHRSIGKLLIVQ